MSKFPDLSRLENDFSVAEVLSRAKRPMRRQRDLLAVTPCPACDMDAWLLPTGLFCNSTACKFAAGGPLEYLAALYKLRIPAAFDKLKSMFPERRHFWDSTDAAILREVVVDQVVERRRLFEFFTKLADRPSVRGDLALAVEHTLEWRSHLGPRQLTLFHASPTDLQELLRMLEASIPYDDTVVLFPYFRRHHHVAAVTVFCPKTRQTYVLETDPARFMFSGLLDVSPMADKTYLLDDPVSALRAGAAVGLRSGTEGTLGLLVNYDESRVDYMPNNAVFCLLEDTYPGLAATYRQADPTVRFLQGRPPTEARPLIWEDYVERVVLEALRAANGKLEFVTSTFAQSAELAPAERKSLIHAVQRAGFALAAERLAGQFSTRTIYKQKNLCVNETPTGYVAVRGASKESISNFTFELSHNLVFDEGSSLYHSGKAMSRGRTYEVIVSSDDMAAPGDFQTRVQRAVLSKDENPGQLPIIRSRPLWKHVSLVLREQVGSLDVRRGVSSLGWQHTRTRYTMPGCVIGMDGAQPGPFEFHPDRPVLSYLESFAWDGIRRAAPTTKTDGGYVTAGLADIARIVLGGIFRDYFNLAMSGVALRQFRTTQHVVERVFRQLGQIRPFVPNGPPPEGLGRFPVYGYEHSIWQIQTCPWFLINMGQQGMPLADLTDLTDDEVDDFGRWLMSACVTVVEHLLARSELSFPDEPHVVFVNTVISDGENLLRHVLGIEWPSQPLSFAAFEGMLAHLGTPERLAEICSLEDEGVWLRYAPYNTTEEFAHALELELRSQTTEIITDKDRFRIPSPIFHGLVQNYYRRTVIVPK